MSIDYCCSRCLGDNVQKVSIVISSGTTTTDISLSNTGSVGGMWSHSHTKSTKESISDIAKQFNSEEPPANGRLVGLVFIITMVLSITVGAMSQKWLGFWWPFAISFFVIIVGISIKFSDQITEDNTEAERKNSLYKRWVSEGFYCWRCGNVYIPGCVEKYPFRS